jgi:hypothetical protein
MTRINMNDLFPITDPSRNYGCRINDNIKWNGIGSVLLQNEKIQVLVHPEKGSEISQFLYKPLDIDFIWRNPNSLHNPTNFSAAAGDDTSPFLDHWSGAWFEALPNGGPASKYKGAQLGFFAETVNIPWEYQILRDDPDCIQIGLWVKTYRTPFLLRKTLTLRSGIPALFIEEQLTNLGKEEMQYVWVHHPVIGPPFLSPSCRISSPDCKTIVWEEEDGPDYRMKLHQESSWPYVLGRNDEDIDLRIILPPDANTMDNVYLTDFAQPWFAVTNMDLELGIGLVFDPEMWKYILLWQGFGGGIGYPWYHRTYHMGIEPWSSFPCAGLEYAIDNKTARSLQAGESVQTWLTMVAYENNQEPSFISPEGTVK